MPPRSGILFVLSAPSGGGKSTLLRLLSERGGGGVVYSISCTTRLPRPGEEHGRDYHFLSATDFEDRAGRGEFLEHAQVHANRYGTLRATVLAALDAGQDVLMDIDIQGAAQIRANADARLHSALVDVFLMPPSAAELERRLRKRATETDDQLALRLSNAATEMAAWTTYRYTILSGSPEEDYAHFTAILTSERLRSERLWLTFPPQP
jgi:guanylate kinase